MDMGLVDMGLVDMGLVDMDLWIWTCGYGLVEYSALDCRWWDSNPHGALAPTDFLTTITFVTLKKVCGLDFVFTFT